MALRWRKAAVAVLVFAMTLAYTTGESETEGNSITLADLFNLEKEDCIARDRQSYLFADAARGYRLRNGGVLS